MGGRKQHYLPQFLQRSFAHRRNKDTYYVHVHERDTRYSPNTAGVGAIRDFYSTPEDTLADDNITEAESVLGRTVNQIICHRELLSIVQTAQLFSSLSAVYYTQILSFRT
jgi:hypothetical protein